MSPEPLAHPSFVYHFAGAEVLPVPSVAADAGRAEALPETLVIPPGTYSFRGESYRLDKEGLYRLLCPPEENHQRIVYRSDVLALMSGVGWLHCHGSRDDFKDFDEVIALARTDKLVLTCGPYTKIVTTLFGELGVPIRTVCVRTLLELNGYNDGHVLSEIRLDGRWVVFDIDPHRLYRFGGRRLSLLELIPHVQAHDCETEPLAGGVPFAITNFINRDGTYDYGLWYETIGAEAGGRQGESFRRVMMIPIIPDEGAYYYTTYTDAQRERAETLWPDLRYLPLDAFRARFYSGGR